MQGTKIIKMCGVDGCSNWIVWEFDPGELPSREHPGMPDSWYPASGCKESKEIEVNGITGSFRYWAVTHMEYLANDDDTLNELDYIAQQNYDSDSVWGV